MLNVAAVEEKIKQSHRSHLIGNVSLELSSERFWTYFIEFFMSQNMYFGLFKN